APRRGSSAPNPRSTGGAQSTGRSSPCSPAAPPRPGWWTSRRRCAPTTWPARSPVRPAPARRSGWGDRDRAGLVVGGAGVGPAGWRPAAPGRSGAAPDRSAMHELAITEGVVEAVTERTGRAPVTSVRLRVGRLSGVVPDAMRFCFELVTAGTPLAGAVLEID